MQPFVNKILSTYLDPSWKRSRKRCDQLIAGLFSFDRLGIQLLEELDGSIGQPMPE